MKDSTNSTFLQQNETKIKLLFVIVVLILIAVQVYLSSWLIFKGDVYFNEDIARDFLIIEDIVTNHHITLIGPRTLAVGGLFHGPLWLYVNLPAYLLGHGNPVFMGEFWVFLYILYIGIVYYVARKLFDPTVGLLSALLLTSTSYMYFFNNTFGAVLLFPIYFYCFTRYLKTLKLRMLATVFFLNGLLIQFELAFGIPVLIISLLYLLYFLSKMKKLQHLLWLWIIFIPLSTYIIFDLRHNFIELHAIVQYIFSKKASLGSFFTFPFVYQRIVTITNSSLQFLNHNSLFLNVLFIGVCVYATYIIKKRKNVYYAQLFSSFVILYLGYWVITLFTKVTLWVWYYYEFTSVLVILFCATYRLMNRTIFIILFFLFY